jgi:GNAT superfamily N-acetyltransferase
MVHIEHRATEIYLSRLELAPTHQGRGIGTRIIQDLKALAAGRGHTLTLGMPAADSVPPQQRAIFDKAYLGAAQEPCRGL